MQESNKTQILKQMLEIKKKLAFVSWTYDHTRN